MSPNSSNKDDGLYYEQLFVAEALKREFGICRPVGNLHPYDVMLMDGPTNIRVQVKGTQGYMDKRGHRRYQFLLTVGSRKEKNNNYDIFAGFAKHKTGESWYMIPRKVVKYKTVQVFPDTLDSSGKYEKYKGGWDIFKRPV